jgi:hypothetical protein
MPTNRKETPKEEQEFLEQLGKEALRRNNPPGDNTDLFDSDQNSLKQKPETEADKS